MCEDCVFVTLSHLDVSVFACALWNGIGVTYFHRSDVSGSHFRMVQEPGVFIGWVERHTSGYITLSTAPVELLLINYKITKPHQEICTTT